jgi:hypothetical protein
VPGDVTSSEDEAWQGVDEPMVKPGGKGEYLYQNNWYHTQTIGTIPKHWYQQLVERKRTHSAYREHILGIENTF